MGVRSPDRPQRGSGTRFARFADLTPVLLTLAVACSAPSPRPKAPAPSILLVTLDTTRYDAIGPDAAGIQTPSFNALAARGARFRQAYATVPETLPSHTSLMTGLYPAGHGVHENGRSVGASQTLLAERLHQAGYRTRAFVSSFTLARRFGLARGFDGYDDAFPSGAAERGAAATTDAAIASLQTPAGGPLFMWVHYNDPHAPYEPPEPYRTRYANTPYLGEVAAMDEQLGRLAAAFEQRATQPIAMIVVADHGEGLGDHGEPQHGLLLYQSTMHVPLIVIGPGVAAGVMDAPVSTRRVFHTVLDWAGIDAAHSLRERTADTVLGEAMKPFLDYGWQPQSMLVDGTKKGILAGRQQEIYDVLADPAEARNLNGAVSLSGPARATLLDYPAPSPDAARAPDNLNDEERRKLASLGYVSAGSAPAVRKDAPRPVDMAGLFGTLEEASTLFVEEQYARVIPVLDRVLAADPGNLDAVLRLAAAHSALGHNDTAIAMFQKAIAIAPKSPDVRLYLGLHYARAKDLARAAPLLEDAVRDMPDRLPAVEGLATIRERQGRAADAVALWRRAYALRTPTAAELVHLGTLAMDAGDSNAALDAFERARALQGRAFTHDLELGVLYLDLRRYDEARQALDRVPASSPQYPMALFKRAQASVLLHEPDAGDRIRRAREHADATTRPLIEREKLFKARTR